LLFREGWSMGDLKRMATAGAEEAKAGEAEQLSKISQEMTLEKQKEIRR
jgi:hypothetical protein